MKKLKYLLLLVGLNLLSAQNNESKINTQQNVDLQNIEVAPIYPGCEKLSIDKIKNCFQEKIQEHIRKNLIYPKEAIKNKTQGKVYVSFVIEEDGSVTIGNIIGRSPILKEEARRIISLLPKIKPGISEGKPAKMTFNIPITFDLTK